MTTTKRDISLIFKLILNDFTVILRVKTLSDFNYDIYHKDVSILARVVFSQFKYVGCKGVLSKIRIFISFLIKVSGERWTFIRSLLI